LNEIEEFLTGERHAVELDRVLATVMFTDIVSSTERISELGDRRWRDLLDSHNTVLTKQIAKFRGRVVKAPEMDFSQPSMGQRGRYSAL
jgi:class 3 adenylate cyclase